MIYQRSTRCSFQQWANAVNVQSYTFDKFLPSYKKRVRFTLQALLGPTMRLLCTTLPLSESRVVLPRPLMPTKLRRSAVSSTCQVYFYRESTKPFLGYVQGALNKIGILTIPDFNSGSLLGTQYCSTNIDLSDKTRESSHTTFLNEAIHRD